MTTFTKYIANEEHYSEVISRIAKVRETLWIGTADIKDVYVKQDGESMPLLGQLAALLKRGVGVRLVHAKEPGPNFREDFDRYPILVTVLERVMCPRVHFKMMIFDLETAYIGSANLTGAGIGMKKLPASQLRGGYPHERPGTCRARYRTVRYALDGHALQKMRSSGILW